MKSLFETLASGDDLSLVFNQSSRVLKEMNLRSLFMSLTMIKLDGTRLRIASAGMPRRDLSRGEGVGGDGDQSAAAQRHFGLSVSRAGVRQVMAMCWY